eukprot:403345674
MSVSAEFVPDYDNRCWACLMNPLTLNAQIYCPADNRCYNSTNDTCSVNFAYNPYDCLKLPALVSTICNQLQFTASGAGAKQLFTRYTYTNLVVENDKGCQFQVSGTGSWLQINYTEPVQVYINAYYKTQFTSKQLYKSGENLTIGKDLDTFLSEDVADKYYIGIVNPTASTVGTITAIMYQAAVINQLSKIVMLISSLGYVIWSL